MQDVITIISLIVAAISGLASILWSNQYKEAKQAQIDAKDEQIKTLKLLSSSNVTEAFFSMKEILEEENNNLKTRVEEFRLKNESLESQIEKANLRIEDLEKEILGISTSETVRSVIHSYTVGSRKALQDLGRTVRDLKIVEQNIQKSTDEISRATVLEINPIPTESVTMTDIAKVEITGPDSNGTENDDPEAPQPADA